MVTEYNSEVCIVGLGPAGIGAALTLGRSNLASKVLCLEMGDSIDNRHCTALQNSECDKEKPCQLITGFGGCSLLSAGKISAFPAGSEFETLLGSKNLAREKLSEALRLLRNYLPLRKQIITSTHIKNGREFFKKLGFNYKYYDVYLFKHEGIVKAYQQIFQQLKTAKIKLSMNTRLTKIDSEGNIFKLVAKRDGQNIVIFTKYLLLGLGRSGQNLLSSLNKKFKLGGNTNHLELGVRLEFPSKNTEEIDKYHKDLKLLYKDFRTYCLCKEGKLAFYYLDGLFRLDGRYDPSDKTGFTNIGIMLRQKPSAQNEVMLNEMIKRVLKMGHGLPLRQPLVNYLNPKMKKTSLVVPTKSSISTCIDGDINQCFPESISAEIRDGVHKFISAILPEKTWKKVSVFAPAIEYDSLDFPIKSNFSVWPRTYLIGDCTGRFRGILQSFCSGIICAESIIGNFHGTDI